jgi:hypothetical protein
MNSLFATLVHYSLFIFVNSFLDDRTFSSQSGYQDHLLDKHLTKGDILRPMKKGRPDLPDNAKSGELNEPGGPSFSSSATVDLRRICGIVNESGNDCFAISVLHLLGQTELPDRLAPIDHHSNCLVASCLAAHFFSKYRSHRTIKGQSIFDNYPSFGVSELPVDCGDFLRSALESISRSSSEHLASEENMVKKLFLVCLQWKFECPKCNRFSVMNLQDYVMRIDGSKEGTFQELLNNFLHKKICR